MAPVLSGKLVFFLRSSLPPTTSPATPKLLLIVVTIKVNTRAVASQIVRFVLCGLVLRKHHECWCLTEREGNLHDGVHRHGPENEVCTLMVRRIEHTASLGYVRQTLTVQSHLRHHLINGVIQPISSVCQNAPVLRSHALVSIAVHCEF